MVIARVTSRGHADSFWICRPPSPYSHRQIKVDVLTPKAATYDESMVIWNRSMVQVSLVPCLLQYIRGVVCWHYESSTTAEERRPGVPADTLVLEPPTTNTPAGQGVRRTSQADTPRLCPRRIPPRLPVRPDHRAPPEWRLHPCQGCPVHQHQPEKAWVRWAEWSEPERPEVRRWTSSLSTTSPDPSNPPLLFFSQCCAAGTTPINLPPSERGI